MSSLCFPVSTTAPSDITAIVSAFLMVESLWAITIIVCFFSPPSISLSNASWTITSDSESRALVASSRRIILGFMIKTLAIAIRCFCPPESCEPSSPTMVSYPSANDIMKS
mmetsp:Transcript_22659/g.48047  ORF Transcript_22659/g.48047 Transcript_22659/m.48047 type:complete len:111 (+) Transcript_22659:4914-5246(+)